MAIERRQPLPVGRYWVDVRSGQLDPFLAWVRGNPTRIKLERTEAREGTGQGVTWALFSVLRATRFDNRSFGFPTIATPDIQHASDTAQRPPEPTPASTITDAVASLLDSGAGKVIAIAVAAYFLSKGNEK